MQEKEFSFEMIKTILHNLSERNHFFVSEIHLQTEFIIESARLYPNFKYYPELVPSVVPSEYSNSHKNRGIHFDLVIKTNANRKVLIEFKYVTKKYEKEVNGFLMQIKEQSAWDTRRFDSWLDIERIESFVFSDETDIDYGYFILITNVPILWEKPKNVTQDAEFYIYEGEHPATSKMWKEKASKGTKMGRNYPIVIKKDYTFEYMPFYDFNEKNGEFKSLVVQIDK